MGVRADMTPQVARIEAHRLRQASPTRLCYTGTVLRTRPDGFAGGRSPLQLGAELYGNSAPESDAEIVALLVETLALAGVSDVFLDLGHVGIYRGLARQAGLTEREEAQLFEMLQRKSRPEIELFLAELDIPDEPRRMLSVLPELNGGSEVLARARRELSAASDAVKQAMDYLQRLSELLAARGIDLPLHFDLAELRGYHYHSGIVFAAYAAGKGQEIARGGRYDDIGRAFGRARPATGFSTDLKTLIALRPAAGERSTGGVFVPADSPQDGLWDEIARLRAQGERVVCELPGQRGGATEARCDRVLRNQDNSWTLIGA
jgi:ATP phosphoribosyltransferase regulatory subunit